MQSSGRAGGRQQPRLPAQNVRGCDSRQPGGHGANLAVAAAGPFFMWQPRRAGRSAPTSAVLQKLLFQMKPAPTAVLREAQLQRGEAWAGWH